MTAALVVTLDRKQTDKAIVDKDYFLIGRSHKCDLCLDDKNISREHSAVVRKEGGYHVQDRGSRNGTMLNGAPVTRETALKDGDRIGVGPFELQFFEAGDAGAEQDEEAKTSFAPVGGKPAKPKKERAARKAAGPLRYKLAAVDGPLKGTVYADWEGDLVFGRSADNQVVIPDDAVSQKHARLRQEDGLFYLEDFGSSNGTFVQGVRIQNARLQNRQRIRIGSSTFMFTAFNPEKRKIVLMFSGVISLLLLILVTVIALLKPEDPAKILLQKAGLLMNQRQYAEAKKQYEDILQFQRDNLEAINGLKEAQTYIEMEETLAKAQDAAANEQYAEALDICYKLMRDYPKFKKAKELEAVINSVKDSQIAFDARNWPDAIRNLKKAREEYPNSTLLSRMLDRAQAELAAERNLGSAKNYIANSQPDKAEELLLGVPSTSMYYAEAQGLLQQIKQSAKVAESVTVARQAFRLGSVAEAQSAIDAGLKETPDNPALLDLRAHINKICSLSEAIANGRGLVKSDDIPAIRQMIEACNGVVQAEDDPMNEFRKTAKTLADDLGLRLGQIEQDAMSKGRALRTERKPQEAYQHFKRAADANPSNAEALTATDEIRAEIAEECRKLFQQGLIHEDLGQSDLAAAAYEQVLRIALEDDSYYKRAKEKLLYLRK